VDRRVAQGRSPLASPNSYPSSTFVTVVGAACLVAIALVVYTVSHPDRYYNHFTWQAMAFLEGQAAIRYPVPAEGSSLGNAFFQDVLPVAATDGAPGPWSLSAPAGRPPVAVLRSGTPTNGQLIFAVLGALDVGLAWWALGYLPVRTWVRAAASVFFGFGTVFWYAAQLGTTWYQAHVLAVALAFLAIGVALRADRGAAFRDDAPVLAGAVGEPASVAPASGRASSGRAPRGLAWLVPDGRQVLAGILFGLACTSRLTVVFAAPFFLFVGGGGWWLRRGWSAGLGAGIPLAALAVYNLVTTGSLLHPGYQHLYELEAAFYQPLNYHIEWGIEDIRYLPQNFAIMFLNTPVLLPDVVPAALGTGGPLCTSADSVRGLFNPDCPLILPRDTGMSLLLTSPAYLLVLPALRWAMATSGSSPAPRSPSS
jgi:predicted small integral membrane protein